MDKKKYETYLKVILWLSVLGLLTSIYLVKNHYASPAAGAICDFGETVSCSAVNTSIFSELLDVPVALLGALWFVFQLWMAGKALKRPEHIPALLGWNVLGLVAVIYFVIAEIILKALCPFCTVVHVIIIITLVLSYLLYKGLDPQPHHNDMVKARKKWLVWTILVFGLIFLGFNLWPEEKQNYDALAQCMTDKGAVMYSSFRCGVCARVKAMFGSSFRYINEVECHPQGPDAQTALCTAKGIQGTPTWTIEQNGTEMKRHTGFLTAEELADFAGCSVDGAS